MDYRLKEVARPRGARYLVACSEGGHHVFHINERGSRYTLYVGGGTDSEPVFRVEHVFRTPLSVLLYAHYLASGLDQ